MVDSDIAKDWAEETLVNLAKQMLPLSAIQQRAESKDITALHNRVTELQGQVAALQGLQGRVTTLEATLKDFITVQQGLPARVPVLDASDGQNEELRARLDQLEASITAAGPLPVHPRTSSPADAPRPNHNASGYGLGQLAALSPGEAGPFAPDASSYRSSKRLESPEPLENPRMRDIKVREPIESPVLRQKRVHEVVHVQQPKRQKQDLELEQAQQLNSVETEENVRAKYEQFAMHYQVTKTKYRLRKPSNERGFIWVFIEGIEDKGLAADFQEHLLQVLPGKVGRAKKKGPRRIALDMSLTWDEVKEVIKHSFGCESQRR